MFAQDKAALRKSTLIFLHIPKTAGSTLDEIIVREYRDSITYVIDPNRSNGHDLSEFYALPEAERARIDVLKGHLPFGVHQHIPGPSTYITMLRDPVERMISHYHHVLRRHEHHLHQQVVAQNMSLKDYICSGISSELSNDQVRMISGKWHDDPVDHSDLERAQHNLQTHFSLVGITERFEEGFLILRRLFGWNVLFYINLNVAPARTRRSEVDAETLDTIRTYNSLDIELYNYGCALFDETVRQQGAFFRQRTALFSSLNYYYNKAYLTFRRARYKTKLIVDSALSKGKA